MCFSDKDVADSDAKQALGRMRALIVLFLDKVGEPHEATVEVALRMLGGAVSRDEARDLCAVVTRTALTWKTVTVLDEPDPDPCVVCGLTTAGVEFHDDYRIHVHPDCYPQWTADRLAAQEDAR